MPRQYEANIGKWKMRLSQQMVEETEISQYLDCGLQLMANLKQPYLLSETTIKQ
jgi:hypothetical protein